MMQFLHQRLRLAESFIGKLEQSRYLLIGGLTVLYAVSTYVLAARKLMWNDELYTYYIALLPTMADVWAALMAGGEQLPPFFYVVTRASLALFGVNNLALRLPEMIGFWVMSWCLFIFVARRTSNLYGLVAATFPLVTGAYAYAYEARPYGLVLGFGALALLCWQSATIDYFRRLSIFCLALSLAAALSSHYYGVFVVFPLALGEAMRTLKRHRVDAPVWAALGLAASPLLWHLPLIKQARAYSGAFWAPPIWLGIPDFYYNMLGSAVLPVVAMLFLAGIYATIFRPAALAQNHAARAQNQLTGVAPPLHEVAAAFGFVVIPIICVVLAKLVTGAFTDRYAIPAIIGLSILVAFIAAKLFDTTALMAAAVVVCFVGWFGVLELKAVRTVSDNWLNTTLQLIESDSESGLPIVASDPHTFIELAHYAPPEIASRLVYLADPPTALRRIKYDSVERGMIDLLKPWFRLNVTDYKSYVASRPRFLVYGSLGFLSWITPQLKEDGMRIELRGTSGSKFLFLVYPDEQAADVRSHHTIEPSPVR